ncbi:MAG: class I SAM-dependent methyltransferase [Ignavibacteria bacterium]|nr:class I SAM-dependent methyltransferase [Ignavibacteria bacterium]
MVEIENSPDNDKIIDFYRKRAKYHGDENAVLDGSENQQVRFTNIILGHLTKSAMIENLNPKPNEVILDYGCGVGRITFPVAAKAKEIYGVDISPDLLNIANTLKEKRKTNNIHFEQLDPNNPQLADVMFDKIFALGVMLHLGNEQMDKNIPGIYSHLKNDGKLFLLEYTRAETEFAKHEVIIRSVDDFKKDFAKYGFECVSVKPVIRMPSYAISTWKKIGKDWKFMLPFLYQLEKLTINRKPEHILYHWQVFEFKKK